MKDVNEKLPIEVIDTPPPSRAGKAPGLRAKQANEITALARAKPGKSVKVGPISKTAVGSIRNYISDHDPEKRYSCASRTLDARDGQAYLFVTYRGSK